MALPWQHPPHTPTKQTFPQKPQEMPVSVVGTASPPHLRWPLSPHTVCRPAFHPEPLWTHAVLEAALLSSPGFTTLLARRPMSAAPPSCSHGGLHVPGSHAQGRGHRLPTHCPGGFLAWLVPPNSHPRWLHLPPPSPAEGTRVLTGTTCRQGRGGEELHWRKPGSVLQPCQPWTHCPGSCWSPSGAWGERSRNKAQRGPNACSRTHSQ
jgi:hypothetical protein